MRLKSTIAKKPEGKTVLIIGAFEIDGRLVRALLKNGFFVAFTYFDILEVSHIVGQEGDEYKDFFFAVKSLPGQGKISQSAAAISEVEQNWRKVNIVLMSGFDPDEGF